jgi:hypothetical protein
LIIGTKCQTKVSTPVDYSDNIIILVVEDTAGNEDVDPFQRYSPGGSVEVINLPDDGQDLYPPARVVDLLVIAIQHDTRQATIRFTPSGDDLMQGQGEWMLCTGAISVRRGTLKGNVSGEVELARDIVYRGIMSGKQGTLCTGAT